MNAPGANALSEMRECGTSIVNFFERVAAMMLASFCSVNYIDWNENILKKEQ